MTRRFVTDNVEDEMRYFSKQVYNRLRCEIYESVFSSTVCSRGRYSDDVKSIFSSYLTMRHNLIENRSTCEVEMKIALFSKGSTHS